MNYQLEDGYVSYSELNKALDIYYSNALDKNEKICLIENLDINGDG